MELGKINLSRIFFHLAIWLGLWTLPSLGHPDLFFAMLKFLPGILSFALIFYVNYFVIVPKWALVSSQKHPLVNLAIINFGLFLGLIFLLQASRVHLLPPPNVFKNTSIEANFHPPLPPQSAEVYTPPPPPKRNRPFFIDFIFMGLFAAIAGMLRFYEKIHTDRERNQLLETEYLLNELSYLRLQLSPHFLFNTLNNIYTLIEIRPGQAQESILNLSKMLRYMLYETDKDRVSLGQEIQFILSYVDLMNLRLSDKTIVTCNFPLDCERHNIAPLLLLPLIENAYKHGIHPMEPSEIHFQLIETDNSFVFTATNHNFPKNKDQSGSGIGLNNLRKRLELLYGDRANYTVQVSNLYTAQMTIPKE